MARFSRQLWVAVAAVLCACSVELVSPYNVQLANDLSKLHEDIIGLAADVARKATSEATRAKASYENYAGTYDGLRARIETMRVISEIGNPGVVDCARLAGALRGSAKEELERSSPAPVESGSTDCQTYLFVRLGQMMALVEDAHKLACAASNPNFRNDCAGGFGKPAGALSYGPDANGLIVQPALMTVRTLMWVQEAKKPKK